MHICMRYLSLQGYQAILTPQTIPGAILKALQMMMDFQSMEFGNLRVHMMHGLRMVTQILWGLFLTQKMILAFGNLIASQKNYLSMNLIT